MKKFKAVIFDLDGVISDTQCIHAAVEEEVLKEYGIDIPADELTRRFAGVTQKEMFGTIFSELGRNDIDIDEAVLKKRERMMQAVKGNVKEVPGTKEFIEFLFQNNFPLAVASASRIAFIEMVLLELELRDKFKAIASAQEVERGKPDPAVFLLAAERLSVLPQDCLVIEDGLSGMIAAIAAGMKCVALVREETNVEYPADLVVKNLAQVPGILNLRKNKYNKLVRDKIPEYIKSKGGLPIMHIASEEEYWQKLKEKLSEEVSEFSDAESIEELADVLEVIEAIVRYKGFGDGDIQKVKNKKADERGKFEKRIILEES